MKKGKLKEYFPILLIIAITTVVYFSSLSNGFVSDDRGMLKSVELFSRNPTLLFTQHPLNLLNLTYFVNYIINGANPFVFHLTNLIIYLLLIISVYALLGHFLPLIAFWATLIFALHPLNSEAVLFISARPYLLYGLFFTLSLLYYLKHQKTQQLRSLYLSLLLAILAALTNPFAVILPLLFLGFAAYTGRVKTDGKKLLAFFILSLILGLTYIGKIFFYINYHQTVYGTAAADNFVRLSIFKPLLLPFVPVLFLRRFLLIDLPSFHHEFSTGQLFLSLNLLGFIILFKLIDKLSSNDLNQKKNGRLLSYLAFVSLLPPFIPLPGNQLSADRYFLLPTLWTTALFTGLVLNLKTRVGPLKLGTTILIVFVIISGLTTYRRNFDWVDQKTLTLSTLKTSPGWDLGHASLAGTYLEEGKTSAAEAEFEKALALNNNIAPVHYELGLIYEGEKKLDQASSHFLAAWKINPDNEEYRKKVFRIINK